MKLRLYKSTGQMLGPGVIGQTMAVPHKLHIYWGDQLYQPRIIMYVCGSSFYYGGARIKHKLISIKKSQTNPNETICVCVHFDWLYKLLTRGDYSEN